MRVIDGARGEGGGQVLRTALALSLLSDEPFQLVGIRAGRKRPGLLRQHLCAVQLAAQVGRAEVTGAKPGSRELVFRPRAVIPGDYHVAIGTAGSTTLVLQTVLPALLTARRTSTLVLEGGTHDPLVPPFEFIARAFLPLVNRLRQRLGWPANSLRVHALPREVGPGNVLCAVVESEQVTEVFTGFGEKSVRAEGVAEGVAAEVRADLEAGVPVGAHLADQLILLLAMAGWWRSEPEPFFVNGFRRLPACQINFIRRTPGIRSKSPSKVAITSTSLLSMTAACRASRGEALALPHTNSFARSVSARLTAKTRGQSCTKSSYTCAARSRRLRPA